MLLMAVVLGCVTLGDLSKQLESHVPYVNSFMPPVGHRTPSTFYLFI